LLLATGLNISGIYAGAALGGLGGFLAEHFGWRFGFRLFGAIGIVYCFVLLFTLREAPNAEDDPRPLSQRPLAPRRDFLGVLTTLLSSPAFLTLLLLNILVGVVNWSVYGWMPTFRRSRVATQPAQIDVSGIAVAPARV
jgi:MFS family permease